MPIMTFVKAVLAALAPFLCAGAAIGLGSLASLAVEWRGKRRRCTAVLTARLWNMRSYGIVGRGGCLHAATFRAHYPGREHPSEFVITSRDRAGIGPAEQELHYDPDDPDTRYLDRDVPAARYWVLRCAGVLALAALAAMSALFRAGIL